MYGGGSESATYTGDKTITGGLHVTTTLDVDGASALNGAVTVGETLDPETLTLTCAGVGLAAPVGAWSCSGDTITRTASGSNLTLAIGPTVTAGETYKGSVTYATLTAGTFSLSVGGRAQATHSTSGAKTEYFQAVPATTAPTLTAVAASAGTITLSSLSVRKVTSVIAPASDGLLVQKTFAGAVSNESGLVVRCDQTGAAGDKSCMDIYFTGAAGSGSEYLLRGWNIGGTSPTVSIMPQGTVASAGIVSTESISAIGSYFTSNHNTPGTIGVYRSNGAFANVFNSVFTVNGTPVAHTNATAEIRGFDFSPTLSAAHSAAAPTTALYMGSIHTNGSILETNIIKAASADNLDYVVNTPNFSVTGAGNLDLTGNFLGNGPIYATLHINGTAGITEALTDDTYVQIVDGNLVAGACTASHTTCNDTTDVIDVATAGTYDVSVTMSSAIDGVPTTEILMCAVFKEGTKLENVAFHRTASNAYGVSAARGFVTVSANDTFDLRCFIDDASPPNLLIEHLNIALVRLGD